MTISEIRTTDNVSIFKPNGANRVFQIDKKDYGNIFRVAIGKLFGGFFNTAKSCLEKLFGITCCTVAVPSGYTIKEEYLPILDRLKYQTDLGDDATHKYCEILAKLHPSAQLIDTYLMNNRSEPADLPARGNGIKQLMIPIVLEEFPKNHIVAAFVSFDEQDNATIEYYDSKGLKIGDRGPDARLAYCDLSLGQVLASIADTYCPNLSSEDILQNGGRVRGDQRDCHNCGVYVCNYFEQRLNHNHPSIIYRTCNSFQRTVTMREKMVRNVLLEAREPIPTKVTPKDAAKTEQMQSLSEFDDDEAALDAAAEASEKPSQVKQIDDDEGELFKNS